MVNNINSVLLKQGTKGKWAYVLESISRVLELAMRSESEIYRISDVFALIEPRVCNLHSNQVVGRGVLGDLS
jgi:hypothetical protein